MYDMAEHLMAGDLIIMHSGVGRHREGDDYHSDMYLIVNPPRDHNPSHVIIDLEDMWTQKTAQLIVSRLEIVEIARVWS